LTAEDTSETGRLRASLRQRHDQLAQSGKRGADRDARLAEEILGATEQLLSAEAAAAAAEAERRRGAQARVIRAATIVAAAGVFAFTVIYLLAGWADLIWLILFAPVMLAAAALAWLEPGLPGGEQQDARAAAAGLLCVSGLLGALTAARVLPGWVAILAVLAAACGGMAWVLGQAAGLRRPAEPGREGRQ
jgi:hypothetical protein